METGGATAARPARGPAYGQGAGSAPERACADVDLAAIRANVGLLRDRAAPAQVMAVVKADGYGHGMVPVARAAVEAGASWLGVAVLEEALALRAAGLTRPRILSWLAAPGERWKEALAADVDVVAGAPWQLAEIVTAARATGRVARVHLEVDTGLGRGGATARDWPDLVRAAAAARAEGTVVVAGMWSHLACADVPDHPETARQVARFRAALETAERAGVRPELAHLANSAGTLTAPATHFDLVRAGIATYGLSPVPEAAPAHRLGLRPAMTLRSRLALVKRVPEGQGVSYGHRYVTDRETTLGLVPLGYGDGVLRAATNTGPILAAGRRRTIAGTVCMDQLCVDLGDDPARAGDAVVLFGPGDGGEPTAQDWADAVGTISYEIVTRLGGRVPRGYRSEAAGEGDR